MPVDISTAVTGTVLNGFTLPTYTLTTDQAPLVNARQSFVSALGGTQTSVRTHGASDPFTVTVIKPKSFLGLPKLGSLQGSLGPVGRNKTTINIRKGTIPLTGQNPQISELTIDSKIIAGSELNDTANLAAMYSLGSALLAREAANLFAAIKAGST